MEKKKREVFYEKKYLCPLCQEEFVSIKPKISMIKKTREDTDFCPYYEGVNPLFYGVVVCPICGYSWSQDFLSTIDGGVRIELQEKVTKRWKKKEYTGMRDLNDAIKCYHLALYCGQIQRVPSGMVGSLALRCAWLYRYQKEVKKEEHFLEHALINYEKAYVKEELPFGNVKEDALLFLLGELNRRLKRYVEAINWFSRQVKLPEEKNRPFIKNRTREQWSLTQEERKG